MNTEMISLKVSKIAESRYFTGTSILDIITVPYNDKSSEHTIQASVSDIELYTCKLPKGTEVYTSKVILAIDDPYRGCVYAGDTIRVFVDRKGGIDFMWGGEFTRYDDTYEHLIDWLYVL